MATGKSRGAHANSRRKRLARRFPATEATPRLSPVQRLFESVVVQLNRNNALHEATMRDANDGVRSM
jgi:hypothetical protein